MGLTSAISAALSGLQATQAGIGVVADNVANAGAPGYARKTLLQTAAAGGGVGTRVIGINREIDLFIQRQLRAELAGGSYANTISNYYQRIDMVYGRPGGSNAVDTLFNNFANSLQALATSPEAIANRSQVLNDAAVLAQQLNAMSQEIQSLRSEAEIALGNAVLRVNGILSNIEDVCRQLGSSRPEDPATAALLDVRDNLIGELSALIDIRVIDLDRGQVSIFTSSGVSLFDHKASVLRFDSHDSVNPHSLWSTDPQTRGVGSITLITPSGAELDLVTDRAFRSGGIAAHLEMRDKTLVQAQSQLDEIAHSLALALSTRTQQGEAAVDGGQAGFDLDLAALQDGNSITIALNDNGTQRTITIVRVDDPSSLPLNDNFTPLTGDEVIGVSFANGLGDVVSALNAALGPALDFDNPSGDVLRVLNDGTPDVTVTGASASITSTVFDSGDPSLPFFVDGSSGVAYTNSLAGGVAQKLGFAARIALNPALHDDPSRLVVYSSSPPTPAGDFTRPDFMREQLMAARMTFSPATGIGTTAGPFSGTVSDFVRQMISFQGAATENAARLKEGQDIVVNALQARYAERANVNIDSEMANLLVLQTAYAANARVLTAVRDMMDAIMRL